MGTTSHVPFNTLYNYSYTQTLLYARDLEGLNNVVGFSFYAENSTGNDCMTDCEVYLGHTNQVTFTSGTDWLSDTALTLVYSGDMVYTEGWNVFEFDTPFTYDGQSNLIIAVLRNDGTWSSSGSYRVRETPDTSRCIYVRQDSNPYSMANPGSGTRGEYYSEFRLLNCGASGCPTPGNVRVTDQSYNQATVAWNGAGNSYEVAIHETVSTTWPTETSVSGNSYTFTNLMPSTTYTARVRQNCGEELGTSAWAMVTFTTDSLPCFAPENLEIVSTTNNGVTVNWSANTNQSSWVVRIFNTTYNHEYTVNSHPATLDGLSANNTYNVTVAGMCGGVLQSDWSDTIQFTTVACNPVSNVTATVNGGSATIAWTSGSNNVSWQILYGEDGEVSTDDTPVSVTTNPYTITGLANGDYEVYVQAVCGTGWFSGWSENAHATFTIEGQGIADINSNLHVDIYPNPTSNATTISLSGVNGEVTIAVVDMNGRTIQTDRMECSGDCTKKLEVSGLAQGAYFVRIYGENVNTVKKLIVK